MALHIILKEIIGRTKLIEFMAFYLGKNHEEFTKKILVEIILNYLSYVKALMLPFCFEFTFIN